MAQSRKTFGYHKASIDAVKLSIDKLKVANKGLAPSLADAAKGFNMMNNGLAVAGTNAGLSPNINGGQPPSNVNNAAAEFQSRQQQLDQERQQAVQAARDRGESVLKVEQEYDQKQKQLDSAQLAAQLAIQQLYLASVDKLSAAVTGIFGKIRLPPKPLLKPTRRQQPVR